MNSATIVGLFDSLVAATRAIAAGQLQLVTAEFVSKATVSQAVIVDQSQMWRQIFEDQAATKVIKSSLPEEDLIDFGCSSDELTDSLTCSSRVFLERPGFGAT